MITTQQKGKGPRPQLPTRSLFESISQEVEQAALRSEQIKLQDLFWKKIEAGEKRKIRFLSDYDDGMPIWVHNRYRKGAEDNLFDAVCHAMWGLDCPHCADMDFDTEKELKREKKIAWPVFLFPSEKEIKNNLQRGRFAIFFFKHTKLSVVGHITRMFGDEDLLNGTLLENDLLIGRTGSGISDTVYSVNSVNKAKNVHTDHLRIPNQVQLLELATRAFNPALFKILDEAGIDNDCGYWLENRGEEVIPDQEKRPKAQIPGMLSSTRAPKQQAAPSTPYDTEGDDLDDFDLDKVADILSEVEE